MPEKPNTVSILLTRLANDLRCEWDDLVEVSSRILKEKETIEQVAKAIAASSKCGIESIKRKILAVHYAQKLGYTVEEIKSHGQEKTLSVFQKSQRQEKYGEQVWMKFKLAGSLRELAQQQIDRVSEVLAFHTSEEFFEWFVAQLQNTTDEELKHAAGQDVKKKSKKTG